MDITKLFEIPEHHMEPLSATKLNEMIEAAVTQPQHYLPANQNQPWFRRALAVAAAIVIAVTVSLQFAPVDLDSSPVSIQVPTNTASSSDIYDDLSNLMMLDTIDNMS